MSDPMPTVRNILGMPEHQATITPINDDIQAAGDDLRDIIDRDLIVKDPPPADWTPRPEDLA